MALHLTVCFLIPRINWKPTKLGAFYCKQYLLLVFSLYIKNVLISFPWKETNPNTDSKEGYNYVTFLFSPCVTELLSYRRLQLHSTSKATQFSFSVNSANIKQVCLWNTSGFAKCSEQNTVESGNEDLPLSELYPHTEQHSNLNTRVDVSLPLILLMTHTKGSCFHRPILKQ